MRVAASMEVIMDEPLPLKAVAQNQKSETGTQNPERSNLNYEQAGYVVFKNNTTKYDLNNRFDVIEATIDYLFKYPQQRVLLAVLLQMLSSTTTAILVCNALKQ